MKNETYDNEILEMALQGYESMKRKMDEKIAEVRKMLLGEMIAEADRPQWTVASWGTGQNTKARKILTQISKIATSAVPAKPTQHTHRTRKPYTFSDKGREARLAGTKRYWAEWRKKKGAKSASTSR